MMIGVFFSWVGVWRGGLAQSLWWFSRVHHLSTRGIAASQRFLRNMTFSQLVQTDETQARRIVDALPDKLLKGPTAIQVIGRALNAH